MNHMSEIQSPLLHRRSSAAGAGARARLRSAVRRRYRCDAADGTPEVNAWVVINPDDTVVIRIASSEMGQGTLTGLAQLVAEELDCDWSKVSTEFPTPGQNLARKRVWGDYFTAGSQGIRSSQELVRKGGAAARMMLIQAAADDWNVPAAECSAANSVITHEKSGRKTTFGKVANAAVKLDPPKDIPLKDPKTWTIAGQPLKRLDTPPQDRSARRSTASMCGCRTCSMRRSANARYSAARSQATTTPKSTTCRASRRSSESATIPSRWSPTHGGAPRRRSKPCRSPGTRARTSKSPPRRSRNGLRRVSTPKRPSSATRPATPRARCPARRRSSKRNTPIRIRATRRWSR